MPELIETLVTYIKFTPALNGNFVIPEACPQPDETGYRQMVPANGNNIFTKGENIRLISVGYILPGGFQLYTDDTTKGYEQPAIGLVFKNGAGTMVYPYEYSGCLAALAPAPSFFHYSRSTHFVPYPGEYFLNVLLNTDNTRGLLSITNWSDFSLYGWLHNIRISMVGVPESLLDIDQHIKVYAKIAHNIPLYSIPE